MSFMLETFNSTFCLRTDLMTQDTQSDDGLEIAPFYVMSVLARAKELEAEGKDVIHLEVGEPDFKTPDAIIEQAHKALDNGHLGYTPANGILELRQHIANFYREQFGVEISPDRIFITPGASGALQLAMKACIRSDQKLLLTEPGYPCNANIAKVLGIETQHCMLEKSRGYQPNTTDLFNTADETTGAMLLASPGNPTGSVIPQKNLEQLSELAMQQGWQLIMDEIYSGLVYGDQQARSVLQINNNAWVVQSFSKYFQMTGWRLGWLIVPEGFQSIVMRLAQNLYLSAPSIAQFAALAGFTSEVIDQLEARRLIFDERRQYMITALTDMGFEITAEPDGAFYVYADASAFTDDSLSFCEKLLEEACVAVAPGVDFGGLEAHSSIRFAYTQDIACIKKAMKRISGFIEQQVSEAN